MELEEGELSVSFDNEVSLKFSYENTQDVSYNMNSDEWFALVVPFDKTITLKDPKLCIFTYPLVFKPSIIISIISFTKIIQSFFVNPKSV